MKKEEAIRFLFFSIVLCSGFAVAAQHMHHLMGNHFLDGGAGRREVLARVKMIRMLHKILAQAGRHGQAQIGVDVR